MNIETLVEYCMAKKGVEETFPFDDVTLVLKVMGKMFALIPTDNETLSLALKCDPEYAIELRERHEEITAAWHMSKKHWNGVNCEGTLKAAFIYELVDHSYDMVVKGLTKKDQLVLSSL
jgi:predicted DNA-binding protein (MmcQ/YjbR family)